MKGKAKQVAKTGRRSGNANREELDGAAIHGNIQELLVWFMLGLKPVYPRPRSGVTSKTVSNAPLPPVTEWVEMTRDDIERYKTVLASQFKLLNKVWPDLKAIDFNDRSQVKQYDDLELAQRLDALMGGLERSPATVTPLRSIEGGKAVTVKGEMEEKAPRKRGRKPKSNPEIEDWL